MHKGEVLFRNGDLMVRRGGVFGGSVCFITFSPFGHDRSLERPGFGEAFLDSRGIDAIHVICRTNAWFDHPGIADALVAAATGAAGFARVITYGSSMGGYAAIRFAELLGARTAIAISPQYGLGPGAPFEDRFRSERALSDSPALGPTHGSATVMPHVFFDPHDLDRLHVARILRAYPRARLLPLPHAGHPAGPYLDELELLTGAVTDIAADAFDAARFVAVARARRRWSSHYLFTLARRLGPHHRAAKLALVGMAIDRRDDPTYRCYLATLLEMTGDIAGAEDQLRRARALLPDHAVIQYAQTSFLMRRGRWSEAQAVADQIAAQDLDQHRLREMLTVIHARTAKRFAAPREAGPGPVPSALWTPWLRLIRLRARLDPLRLPLLPWHERSYRLDRELRLIDEWRRRRDLRRALPQIGDTR